LAVVAGHSVRRTPIAGDLKFLPGITVWAGSVRLLHRTPYPPATDKQISAERKETGHQEEMRDGNEKADDGQHPSDTQSCQRTPQSHRRTKGHHPNHRIARVAAVTSERHFEDAFWSLIHADLPQW
jgi:hypothetical protein